MIKKMKKVVFIGDHVIELRVKIAPSSLFAWRKENEKECEELNATKLKNS